MREFYNRVYFNSIKVRLKLKLDLTIRLVYLQFQFHKGTIKTSRAWQRMPRTHISIP